MSIRYTERKGERERERQKSTMKETTNKDDLRPGEQDQPRYHKPEKDKGTERYMERDGEREMARQKFALQIALTKKAHVVPGRINAVVKNVNQNEIMENNKS